nr:hypothetical protein BaRGS_014509 [Batillaria attramentaria]
MTLKPSAQLFPQLSKVLKLSRVQEVVFAFALLNSSITDTPQYATQFIKQKLPDLLHSYVDADTTARQEGGLQDAGIEALHLLLSHVVRGRDTFGIGKEQREALLKTLRRDFPRDRVPAVLSPLLYPETEDIPLNKLADLANMPSSMFMIVVFISPDECRGIVMQLGVRELTPLAVARVLGMMARTTTGLGDAQQQPAPSLSWKDVVAQLDHPGFHIPSKKGLRVLVQGLFRGLHEVFPVHLLFRPWNNTEGQLSFILQALRHYDIFCFADHLVDVVVIDILKSAPNEDDREIATWKSLNLVETLLRLSEAGHYQAVFDAFKFPMTKCPDILVLALLQTTPTWNTLKQELISNLMSIFLGSHPNSAAILHYAWHHQSHSSTIRTLIMHSMAEWYMRGEPHDQMRLGRILDVAQDLKALSMLLNATPYAFVVDLACLATRREYLNMEKWLTDKITEHKEPFILACVTFLKQRCPQLLGSVKEEQPQTKSQQLPPDTIAAMLTCLKAYASHVSQELQEKINTMCSNASVYLNKLRPNPVGPVGPKSHNFPPNMVNQVLHEASK